MIIQTPEIADATGHVAEMYRHDLDEVGVVLTHTRAMAVNPEAHHAFEDLMRTIVPSIGVRTYELVTLAAAGAVGSPHCRLAHGGKTLRAGVMDAEQLARTARDFRSAGLSDADVAVMAYAEKLSTAPDDMTDEDSLALRAVGFSDRQIFDITLAAAARNYLSRALQALAVPVDDMPGLTPELAEALLAPVEALRQRRLSGG